MINYSIVEVSDNKRHHTNANLENVPAMIRRLEDILARDIDAEECNNAGLNRPRLHTVYIIRSDECRSPGLYTILGKDLRKAIDKFKSDGDEIPY